MISTYSMYRMLQHFRVKDYQELFKDLGFNIPDEIESLHAQTLNIIKKQPFELHYEKYSNKIWEIYNEIQTEKINNQTGQLPGPDVISQVHINTITTPSYQTLAHVKFIQLPFYKIVKKILSPIILIGNTDDSLQNILKNVMQINLQLYSEEIKQAINNGHKTINKYQMIIRIGEIKNDDSDINDCLPLGLSIKINNSDCPLPQILNENCQTYKIKRDPMPIDCTHYIKLDSNIINNITVSWTPDDKTYVMAMNFTKKNKPTKLIKKIRRHAPIRISNTKYNIIHRFKDVSPFKPAVLSFLVSLNCPLSKTKMFLPGKSRKCIHLQCFDIIKYITDNEIKQKWRCPVCNKPCLYKDLAIDLYFSDIISKLRSNNRTNIQILPEGIWKLL